MDINLDEENTLERLEALKRELINLDSLPIHADYRQICERYDVQLRVLAAESRERKEGRDHRRIHYNKTLAGEALESALQKLNWESQQDGMVRRRLKREKDEAIAPLSKAIADVDQKMRSLKQQYLSLTKAWQSHMQAVYLSEQANKASNLLIVYQDNDLIVVNKPAGLLSVPGRQQHLQDSVLSQLRSQKPKDSFIQAVHRLDQATSGLMVIATTASAHAALSQQFAKHQVHKRYQAILSRPVEKNSGTIDLPIWNDPEVHLKRVVDDRGKHSQTDFRVLTVGDRPSVEFIPHTGRTHQLRIHAAHPKGLNSPIVGDPLYGTASEKERLMLHATALEFVHPTTQKMLHLNSAAPFSA